MALATLFCLLGAGPAVSHAAEPAWLSFGLSAQYTQWQIETESTQARTEGDSFVDAGVFVAVDLHRNLVLQAEILIPYSVSGTIEGRPDPHAPREEFQRLGFFGANSLVRYRPLGRTAFGPIAGAGIAYRHLLDGDLIGATDDGGPDALDHFTQNHWQGLAALGLDWNSGWQVGSVHLSAETRLYGPPVGVANAKSDRLDGIETWAWEVWLGCRLSVL